MVGDSLDDFTGTRNVFLGARTGMNMEDGSSNILIGDAAGAFASSGFENIYIGSSAGAGVDGNLGGSGNIALGNHAGSKQTGFGNVMMGMVGS